MTFQTKEEIKFKLWLEQVDNILMETYDLGVNDAADWPARASFDDGFRPQRQSKCGKNGMTWISRLRLGSLTG